MRNIFFAALVCMLGVCAPALAETRISLRGVDFTDASDVVSLHDRLAVIAKRDCVQAGIRTLAVRAAERACLAAFMDEATAKINQPTMTAFQAALEGGERFARFGDRAPQTALIALVAAMPAAGGVIRSAATE